MKGEGLGDKGEGLGDKGKILKVNFNLIDKTSPLNIIRFHEKKKGD